MTKNDPHASAAFALVGGRLSPDQALALDYVLGILMEPLLSEAAQRCVAEEAFALLVTSFRTRIEAEGDAMDHEEAATMAPLPETWASIQARTGLDKQG